MDDRTIRVRFLAEVGSYLDGVRKAGAATADFGKNISGHGTAVRADMEKVGKGALLMAGGLAIALGGAVKAAIDWESAWAGVNKTVDGTKSQMAELEGGLRDLATTLPATHGEIAAVAEAAGQLGIQRDNIVEFTKVMVDLGETTNLTADQAATSIAQMTNIMQTAPQDVDNLASTLVALGNAGASTEGEILDLALRLAGAGELIGASESDVLAMANAMASLGIQAQLGGGAMSRVLQNIYAAVKDGGDKLEGFAEIAGQSAEDFARDFEADPMRAVDGFIQGLSRIEDSGGNVIGTLRDIGIKGTQDLSVLLRLKGAGDLLSDSLELGSQAWLENSALQEEAAKRYETTASQLGVLRNQVVDVGIDIGGVLLPALKGATDGIGTMVKGFSEMPDSSKTVITVLGGIAAGVTGIIGVVGTVGPKISAFSDSLKTMGGAGQFFGNNLGKIAAGLGLVGIAVGLYTWKLGQNAEAAAEAKARADKYTDAILEQKGAVGGLTDELTLEAIVAGDVGKELRGTKTDLTVFSDAINDGVINAEDLGEELRTLSEAAKWVDTDKLGATEDFAAALADAGLEGTALGDVLTSLSGTMDGEVLSDLIDRLVEQSEAYKTGTTEAKNKAAADKAAGDAAKAAVPGTEAHKQALEDQAEAAKEAMEAIDELVDAERAAIDPLFGMLDATLGNIDAQAALKAAQADGTTTAEDLAKAHQAAAESALDMDAAALQLAGSIETGNVDLDIAKGMLENWVEQGLITQQTADILGGKFDDAAAKADLLAGDRVLTFTEEGLAPIVTKLEELLGLLNQAGMFAAVDRETRPTARSAPGTGTGKAPVPKPAPSRNRPELRAAGGPVWPGLTSWVGEQGPELVQFAAPGRVIDAPTSARMAAGAYEPAPRSYAGSGGPLTIDATFNIPVQIGDREIMHVVKKQVRVEGGDVQKVLGA